MSLESSWQGYNFASDFNSIRGFPAKLLAPKVVWVPAIGNSNYHLGVPEQNAIWMCASCGGIEYTIKGKVVASPSPGYGESYESKFPVTHPSTKSVPTMH